MKHSAIVVFVGFLMGYAFECHSQNWHPGDSLNIIETDTARINQFRNNMIDYTGQDLIDASFPKSWPLFGTNARMAIGGYIKLDYIQDFDGGYDRYQYEIKNVPIPGDGRLPQKGYMNMHGRESRVNIDVRSISKEGVPYRFYFEFDFYNLDRGGFYQTPRLRHIYAVLGRLLFGRTWGTQTDVFALPSTIDFSAGDAIVGIRRDQVRWEDQINDKMNYAIAIEMNDFTEIDPNGFNGQASNSLPMLVGRITKETNSGGRLFLASSLYQLRWDGQDIGPDDSALGWGVSFSGREYLIKDKFYFIWLGSYGKGWGSNVISTLGTNASAIIQPNGELETMPLWSLSGGIVYNISPTLLTNISAASFSLDPSDYRDIDQIKNGHSFHANVIWSPAKSINAGIEIMSLYKENGSGDSGVGNRLQLMLKYLF
ncbi:hypothetical protein E4S40_06260 [Algoriphagus kandeliae]|uniref:Porin n=1 Tax=Algoriphagus kandeliae TaxID=2562278 RepID=A0A4Y9QW79_9BACT|nr:DcaP family trimeric outer membrane transporter [Algoriphagus kandeliae]TFV95822.1 hypothetical protein E4S40_06260 [Algoriphagus kandeliae]